MTSAAPLSYMYLDGALSHNWVRITESVNQVGENLIVDDRWREVISKTLQLNNNEKNAFKTKVFKI